MITPINVELFHLLSTAAYLHGEKTNLLVSSLFPSFNQRAEAENVKSALQRIKKIDVLALNKYALSTKAFFIPSLRMEII